MHHRSAVLGLAVVTMGGQPRPNFGDPLQGLTPDPRRSGPERPSSSGILLRREVAVFNNTSCAKCHDKGGIGGGSDTLETRYGQVIDGVFNSLTQFDGQLLHSKGIGLFNGVDFVGE